MRGQAGPDASGEELRALRHVCHDLLNPASTIRLLAEAARVESQLDPAVSQRLSQITEEAERIVALCTYVLDHSSYVCPVRLDLVAAEVVKSTRFSYGGTVESSTEPTTIVGHAVTLNRVLSNLIDNACRAAGPRGRVRVTVGGDDDHARLEVEDSGPGFGAGPPGRASLGLDIVESLVEAGGGDVTADSSSLGGARLVVTLPVVAGPVVVDPLTAEPTVSGSVDVTGAKALLTAGPVDSPENKVLLPAGSEPSAPTSMFAVQGKEAIG